SFRLFGRVPYFTVIAEHTAGFYFFLPLGCSHFTRLYRPPGISVTVEYTFSRNGSIFQVPSVVWRLASVSLEPFKTGIYQRVIIKIITEDYQCSFFRMQFHITFKRYRAGKPHSAGNNHRAASFFGHMADSIGE